MYRVTNATSLLAKKMDSQADAMERDLLSLGIGTVSGIPRVSCELSLDDRSARRRVIEPGGSSPAEPVRKFEATL
jgi:hypothetical protein